MIGVMMETAPNDTASGVRLGLTRDWRKARPGCKPAERDFNQI